jgi:hypothetical protein
MRCFAPGAKAVFIGTVLSSDDHPTVWDRYPSRYLVRVAATARGGGRLMLLGMKMIERGDGD